jgi:hypothetical protein
MRLDVTADAALADRNRGIALVSRFTTGVVALRIQPKFRRDGLFADHTRSPNRETPITVASCRLFGAALGVSRVQHGPRHAGGLIADGGEGSLARFIDLSLPDTPISLGNWRETFILVAERPEDIRRRHD